MSEGENELGEMMEKLSGLFAGMEARGFDPFTIAASAAHIGIHRMRSLGVTRDQCIDLVDVTYSEDNEDTKSEDNATPTVCVVCVDAGDVPDGTSYRLTRPRETCCLCGPAPIVMGEE